MFAHEQCLVWYTRSRLLSSLTFSIHIQFIMFVLTLIKSFSFIKEQNFGIELEIITKLSSYGRCV